MRNISIYSIIYNDNYEALKKAIDNGIFKPDEHLKKGGEHHPLTGCVAYDSPKCFDLIYELYIGNMSNIYNLVCMAIKKHSDGNTYYFNTIINEPDLDMTSALEQCLIKKKPNIDAFVEIIKHKSSTKNCQSPYIGEYIANLGKIEFLQAFVENCQKKNIDVSLEQLLRCCMEKKKYDMIKYLIDKGVDVNKENPSKYSPYYPLIYACLYGNHKLVKILLDAGANPNVSSLVYQTNGMVQERMSPLMGCVFVKGNKYTYNVNSFYKCANLLLKAGADPNYKSPPIITKGETLKNRRYSNYFIKDYCIGFFNPKILKLLLDNGCVLQDGDLMNLFINERYWRMRDNPENFEATVQICVENGCTFYWEDEEGNTLLYKARKEGGFCQSLIDMIMFDINNHPTDEKREYLKKTEDKLSTPT